MALQDILELIIGIIFVWFLVSLLSLTIQEWISNLFNWRSSGLENTLRRMLDDPDYVGRANNFLAHGLDWFKTKLKRPVIQPPAGLTDEFYKHPIIRNLSLPGKRPSYIPTPQFSSVLFDIILSSGSDESLLRLATAQARKEFDSMPRGTDRDAAIEIYRNLFELTKQAAQSNVGEQEIAQFAELASVLSDSQPKLRPIIETLKLVALPQIQSSLDETMRRLQYGAKALGAQNAKIRKTMDHLIGSVEEFTTDSEQAIALARKNLEEWFDTSMDRLSGVYKRQAQKLGFVIGIFLVIFINVDSIAIGEMLWREPVLRQQLASAAQSQVENGEPQTGNISDLQQQLQALQLPVGWVAEATYSCKLAPVNTSQIFGLEYSTGMCLRPTVVSNTTNWYKWLGGLLLTAVAMTQGAPFWFDLLSKFVNIRSTGIKPEDVAAEKKKK
jgi:hypothetical protein